MINSIEKVKVNEKKYKPSGFNAITKDCSDAVIEKDGISGNKCLTIVAKVPHDVDFFTVRNFNGTYLAYSDNGNVYKGSLKGYQSYLTYYADAPITVGEFNRAEKSGIILIGQTSGCLATGTSVERVNVPYGQVCAVLGDLFFIANDNKLYFVNKSDVENKVKDFPYLNLILMPCSAGNIVGLVAWDKRLVIVCERALLELTAFGDSSNYTVKVVDETINSAKLNYVKKVGNSVFFMDGERLFNYNGNAVLEIETAISFKGAQMLSAAAIGTCYAVLCIRDGREDKTLYVYDSVSKKQWVFNGNYRSLSDGGLFVRNAYLMQFDSSVNGQCAFNWKSVDLDFDTPKRKTLTSINLKTTAAIDVTIRGDFGSKKVRFNAGYQNKRVNLTSKAFSLEIEANNVFSMQDLWFEYAIKGEQ